MREAVNIVVGKREARTPVLHRLSKIKNLSMAMSLSLESTINLEAMIMKIIRMIMNNSIPICFLIKICQIQWRKKWKILWGNNLTPTEIVHKQPMIWLEVTKIVMLAPCLILINLVLTDINTEKSIRRCRNTLKNKLTPQMLIIRIIKCHQILNTIRDASSSTKWRLRQNSKEIISGRWLFRKNTIIRWRNVHFLLGLIKISKENKI